MQDQMRYVCAAPHTCSREIELLQSHAATQQLHTHSSLGAHPY